MKKIPGGLIVVVSFCLASCQKEIGFDTVTNGNGGGGTGNGNTDGTLLIKSVSKNGSDSVVAVYTYDANNRVINEKTKGRTQGTDIDNELRYYRNASGIITHYTQINAELIAVGVDSSVTVVHYDVALSRYTSSVTPLTVMGFTVMDSLVLVYDGSGKVTDANNYQDALGMGYIKSLGSKYTYTGSNLTQMDMYDYASSPGGLMGTYKWTYDAKTNPFNLNQESFILSRPDVSSPNNILTMKITNLATGASDMNFAYVFTYNSHNRPATAVSTQTPGNIVNNVTFYYQ